MEIIVIHFIILGVISGLTKGAGVLPAGPLHAAVGETVMFTTTMTPTEKPLISVDWKVDGRDIITFNVENTTAPEYEGRITLFISTGSLELRNVAPDDSGKYSVVIVPQGQSFKPGSITLEVHVSVSNVKANASSTDLVEFRSSVRLSCSSSGSSLSFLWLNGSSEVTAGDGVQLTDGGSTLTIVNVTRYDQGPFRCYVFNPVSNGTSDPINLTISYGPENVQIKGPSVIYFGKTLTLTCSAESTPSATYTWMLDGTEIHNSSVFTKVAELSDGGSYTCRAMNNITGRTTSLDHVLTVKEESSGGLSAGAITGITIACAAVPVLAGVGYYIYRKKT